MFFYTFAKLQWTQCPLASYCKWLGCEIRKETDGFPSVKSSAVGHLSTRCPCSCSHPNEEGCFWTFRLLRSGWSKKKKKKAEVGDHWVENYTSTVDLLSPELPIRIVGISPSGLPPGICTVTTHRHSANCSNYSPKRVSEYRKTNVTGRHSVVAIAWQSMVKVKEKPATVFNSWVFILELFWILFNIISKE